MNNRWRQKNKAFFRYILRTPQKESKEIPYRVMNAARVTLDEVAKQVAKRVMEAIGR